MKKSNKTIEDKLDAYISKQIRRFDIPSQGYESIDAVEGGSVRLILFGNVVKYFKTKEEAIEWYERVSKQVNLGEYVLQENENG